MGVVSKSQRSCFGREVLSALLNFQFKFFSFLAFLPPARALLHVLYYPPHTLTCLPLTHLLFYLLLVYLLFLLLFFLLLWCVPPLLPLCMKDGHTALMEASLKGRTATVQLLLEAGADTEAKNKVRET